MRFRLRFVDLSLKHSLFQTPPSVSRLARCTERGMSPTDMLKIFTCLSIIKTLAQSPESARRLKLNVFDAEKVACLHSRGYARALRHSESSK